MTIKKKIVVSYKKKKGGPIGHRLEEGKAFGVKSELAEAPGLGRYSGCSSPPLCIFEQGFIREAYQVRQEHYHLVAPYAGSASTSRKQRDRNSLLSVSSQMVIDLRSQL